MATRNARIALAVVVLLGVAAFLPSLRFGFAYDDVHTVLQHPGVRGAFSLRDIFLRDFWGEPLGSPTSLGSYRPIATLTLWFDRALGGGSPLLFHVTNLLLYALLLVVAYRFLARWLADELGETARLVAVLLFATLAIHVEVVANATGRAELLAALASLGALHAALAGRLLVFAVLLLCAVFSKESAYPMAILAPVLVLRAKDRPAAKRVLAISLAVLVFAVAIRGRFLQFRRVDPQMALDNPLVFAPLPRRLLGAMDVFGRYVTHTATGTDLCPDYGYAEFVPGASPWLGIVLAVALVTLLVATFRRAPRVADTLIAFGASYAVVSHVLIPASILQAERVFFFPSFWLIVAVVLLGARLVRSRARLWPLLVGAAGVVAIVQAALVVTYLPAWRNEHSLAAYAVRMCPRVLRTRIVAIGAARRRGDVDEGAWSALAAAAIWTQRPSPIADDFFPDGLEDAAMDVRLRTLRSRVGPAWPSVRAQAMHLLEQLGFEAAAARVATY